MVFACLPTSLLTPCKTGDRLLDITSSGKEIKKEVKTRYLAIETIVNNLVLIYL